MAVTSIALPCLRDQNWFKPDSSFRFGVNVLMTSRPQMKGGLRAPAHGSTSSYGAAGRHLALIQGSVQGVVMFRRRGWHPSVGSVQLSVGVFCSFSRRR